MLHARQVRTGNTVTVQLVGQLTREHVSVATHAFDGAAGAATRDASFTLVVIDLDLVTALDATGVALLVGVRAELEPTSARLSLARASPPVKEVFQKYAVDGLFDFEPVQA